ncbi:hypothetical protein R69619_00388 [Paraburkholderia nemoris]|uniref:hypothetical protein n=1 Tax=Paraburkholderia nemoris TaxID=2793076 RepID=UPI00190CF3EA|nr:hypothetical protein [Paraburkholderia nemoris]MBK3737653.1 hypothetical protein [Paraburkholderia aspalathi]CAE6694009.1 hypothetical protein R69619_00388 [Paraburkholderia nemoris]
MARINQFEALLDDLHRESVAKGYARNKVVRPTIAKSMTLHEVMAKAGIDADKVKPFTGKPATTREKGVRVGEHVMVKGKAAMTDKPALAAEPREHTALRIARLIGEMKQHAQGHDLNGPVTPEQLAACHALARAGEMSQEEVADVEKALSDKRALPLYLLKKLGSGNT